MTSRLENFAYGLKFTMSFICLLSTGMVWANGDQGCNALVSTKICAVNVYPVGWQDSAPLCKDTEAETLVEIEKIFSDFSGVFKKVLCSLDRIFVVDEKGGTAFGGLVKDKQGHTHSFIGLNSAVLKTSPNLSRWASWKEQLSWGGGENPLEISPTLPRIKASLPGIQNDFLYFVLAHEMGHILDFANHVIRFKGGCSPSPDAPDCVVEKSSFGGFDWESSLKVHPELDFPGRSGLCFYLCSGNFLNWKDHLEFYERMFQSGFISSYAAYNIRDDFAESMAYFAMNQVIGSEVVISTPNGKNYSPLSEAASGILFKKFEYIQSLLSSPQLITGGSR